MSKYNYNEKFFKNIDNEEKAYWLGFLYADGCITRFYKNEKIRSMSLEITLQESDKDHLVKFLNSLESNVPIKNKKVKNYNECRVVVNCTKMCEDLISNGCTPRKSLTLTFPDENILKDDFIRHFIRGYFDGDGCVHYSKRMYFYKNRNKEYNQFSFVCSFVGTKDFLNSIKSILNKNGISSGAVYRKEGQKAYEFRIHGKDNIKKYFDYLYNDSSIYMDRKYNKFISSFKDLNID